MNKRLLTAIILILLGSWFIHLWWNDHLSLYILPRYNFLVICTGVFALVSGLFLFAKKDLHWHGVDHHLYKRSLMIFTLPLILGLVLPPAPLSSLAASKRGIATDYSTLKLDAPVNFQIDSTARSFGDWIKILGQEENPRKYEGQKVRVKGFVFREGVMTDGEFYLARFLIRCCSADARPVVLRIKSDESVSWADDQWLAIEGVFQSDGDEDQPLFISLEQVVEIEVPEKPYIY